MHHALAFVCLQLPRNHLDRCADQLHAKMLRVNMFFSISFSLYHNALSRLAAASTSQEPLRTITTSILL